MYSLEYIEDFSVGENDADGHESFTTVERSMPDSLLGQRATDFILGMRLAE
jgi:hypothetical protein